MLYPDYFNKLVEGNYKYTVDKLYLFLIAELDELYEKPVIVQKLEQHLEPHLNKIQYKGVKLGWSLIIWNAVTFVLSIVLCSLGRSLIWICWGAYNSYRFLHKFFLS